MTNQEIWAHVDHTNLKPYATWDDIQALCGEAILHRAASVCIPPSYVQRAFQAFGDQVTICTVIGFPLGYVTPEIKLGEGVQALRDGAGEIDMVVNLGDVKCREYVKIGKEIELLKVAAKDRILKVIVETCYLTQEEKAALCHTVTKAGADFIKTSTGFGEAGAVVDDITLFRQHIGPNVRIKAAGGIRTREQMECFLNLGCERIGTSSAAAVLV